MSDRRQFLTVAQVAEHWSVSTDKVYADIRAGKLRAFDVGKLKRIRREDAMEYGRSSNRDADERFAK